MKDPVRCSVETGSGGERGRERVCVREIERERMHGVADHLTGRLHPHLTESRIFSVGRGKEREREQVRVCEREMERHEERACARRET